jgi:hypothetical protein
MRKRLRGCRGHFCGYGVALRVASMGMGSCVGVSRGKHGLDCGRNCHGLGIGDGSIKANLHPFPCRCLIKGFIALHIRDL